MDIERRKDRRERHNRHRNMTQALQLDDSSGQTSEKINTVTFQSPGTWVNNVSQHWGWHRGSVVCVHSFYIDLSVGSCTRVFLPLSVCVQMKRPWPSLAQNLCAPLARGISHVDSRCSFCIWWTIRGGGAVSWGERWEEKRGEPGTGAETRTCPNFIPNFLSPTSHVLYVPIFCLHFFTSAM